MTLLRGWARDGLTQEQIAQNIGIHRDTLNEWKSRFPDISDALKVGRENADYIVENELFESCKTRTVTVKKPIKLKKVMVDGKKRLEEERIEYAEEQVVVPANVTAQIFYLKNRKLDKWKDKPQENTTEAQNNDMTRKNGTLTKAPDFSYYQARCSFAPCFFHAVLAHVGRAPDF